MKWKNININKSNIEAETSRAVLIKMPHSSDYDGYKFWHPAKLVRRGRHSGAVSIGYTDGFTFKLFKNGNGKYNKFDVLDETEIGAEEFEDAFGVIDENIVAPAKANDYETHKPEEKEVEEVKVEDELKDE